MLEAEFRARFELWRAGLAKDPDTDFDPTEPAPDLQEWLYETYCNHGEVPSGQFAPLVYARRLALVSRALAAVNVTYAASGRPPLDPPLTPTVDASTGTIMVAEQPVHALDKAGVAVEVADGFQCYVMDTQWFVWPLCPRHGTGAHPELIGGAAVWHCSAENHILGPVVA
jgi:hypothetical protein